jgi:hypothetical protein
MIHLNLIEKRTTTFKENSLSYDPRGRNKPIQSACEQQGLGLSISVVVEKDRTGILLSHLNSRDTMPRETHMKPLRISKMKYASMWRTG